MSARILLTCLAAFLITVLPAQRVTVHPNGRFLATEDGQPFFYLADTAWELLHRLDRAAVDHYLQTRHAQGFNVIQTVALAELDGLNTPNPYGHTPLFDNDPARPNPAYFEHVDYVLDRADSLGMYVALLPTWGDKLDRKSWGVGPEVLTTANAAAFGRWLGARYKERDNLIWIIGGDRNPREGGGDVAVWNALAAGILATAGGTDRTLMSYHPQPTDAGGSSRWFHNEGWLDFNMHQTGHCANRATHELISHDYGLQPTKPVLDGEPIYEDHPNCFNAKELGYSVAHDIRRTMYQNVFAGACGQSYGCHDVWQMYTPEREGINGPLRPWREALQLPAANQAQHLKTLMLSRPYFTRIPDQSMVLDQPADFRRHIMATRDAAGSYAMVYLPQGGRATLDLSTLAGKEISTEWYDVRTGARFAADPVDRGSRVAVTAPSSGLGSDWVLVLDARND